MLPTSQIFSVFTSRILAMDLEQSRCNYSIHNVFPSQADFQLTTELWLTSNWTLLYSFVLLYTSSVVILIWFCSVLLIGSPGRPIENTASSIVVFTALFHSNGSYLIVTCVFIAAGMCLPSCSLAMGLHVTVHCFTRWGCQSHTKPSTWRTRGYHLSGP
jgi:hypothetical protein